MRKYLVLVFSAIVAFSLFTACSGNGNSGGGCGGNSNQTTTQATTEATTEEETTTEPEEDPYAFEGVVVDKDDEYSYVTVTGDAITVTFEIDEDTQVSDTLSHGDEISVSYDGDLAETPVAESITVESENQDVENHYVYGTASYVEDGYLVLKYFSNDGTVFTVDDSTLVTGEADKISQDDELMVVFNGEISDETTTATLVYVLYHEEAETQIVAGTIEKVDGTTFTLKTDKDSYTFTTDENTAYTGDKFAVNCAATVQYTGELGNNPVATKIYCKAKETPTKPETTTAAPTTTKAPETTTQQKTTATPTTTKQPKTTKAPKTTTAAPTTTEEPTTKVKTVSDKGTIQSWSSKSCTIKTKKNGTVTLAVNGSTSIALGYFPRVNDEVSLKYDSSNNILLSMELKNRPSYELKGTIVSTGNYYEIKLDSSSAKKLAKEFPDVEIGKDNTISMQVSDNVSIAAGYMPQAGDVIKFKVDKNEDGGDANCKITTLVLVSRSENVTPEGDDNSTTTAADDAN